MNVNTIGQNQMDALNSGTKLSTAKTDLQNTSLSTPKESDKEILIKNNRDTFLRTSDLKTATKDNTYNLQTSRSIGQSDIYLYNKLNGKTLNVSNDNFQTIEEVKINLSLSQFCALTEMCEEAGIEKSSALAVIAHESRFQADQVNPKNTPYGHAMGLMQVCEDVYDDNLHRYDGIYNIAKSYAGNNSDIDDNALNPYGNMAAGISSLKFWKDELGEANMFKGQAAGYNTGSNFAINCDREFRAIKEQIDNIIRN